MAGQSGIYMQGLKRLNNGGGMVSSPLFLSPPFPLSLPLPYLFTLPSPSLRSRPPQIQLGVWGSAVSSPSGVWGTAPAEIEFGVFVDHTFLMFVLWHCLDMHKTIKWHDTGLDSWRAIHQRLRTYDSQKLRTNNCRICVRAIHQRLRIICVAYEQNLFLDYDSGRGGKHVCG